MRMCFFLMQQVKYPGDDRLLHKTLMIESHSEDQRFKLCTILDRINLCNELYDKVNKDWAEVKKQLLLYLGGLGKKTADRQIILARDFSAVVAQHVGHWSFVLQALILNNQHLVGEVRFKLSDDWAIAAFELCRDANATRKKGNQLPAEVCVFDGLLRPLQKMWEALPQRTEVMIPQ